AKSISSIPTILTFYRFLLHPTPTTEPYTLSLHDALPISHEGVPHLTGQETGLRRRDARPPAAHRVERAWRPPRPTERATQLHLEIGRAHVELQSRFDLVCRLLLEKKKKRLLKYTYRHYTK